MDAIGRFLDLYRNGCGQEEWSAFDAVSYWYDPTTVQEMQRMVADNPGNHFPESNLRLSAEEVLARLAILASPDCDNTLEGILDGSRDYGYRFAWALKVAKVRSLPALLSALRRRLNKAETPLPPDASEAERQDYALLEQAGINPTRELAEGRRLSLSMDEHFDDALIAYAESGGTLNDAERSRLRAFGFVGDPRARLEEMLTSER